MLWALDVRFADGDRLKSRWVERIGELLAVMDFIHDQGFPCDIYLRQTGEELHAEG